MAFKPLYDRGNIFICSGLDSNNVPTDSVGYHTADGFIRDVSIMDTYNDNIMQGFSPTGNGTGIIHGNGRFGIRWTEYMTSSADFFDWRAAVLANPDLSIVFIPTVIAQGGNIPQGVRFIFSQMGIPNSGVEFPQEGESGRRTVDLIAVSLIKL